MDNEIIARYNGVTNDMLKDDIVYINILIKELVSDQVKCKDNRKDYVGPVYINGGNMDRSVAMLRLKLAFLNALRERMCKGFNITHSPNIGVSTCIQDCMNKEIIKFVRKVYKSLHAKYDNTDIHMTCGIEHPEPSNKLIRKNQNKEW